MIVALAIVHFAIALAIGQRSLADYFSWHWVSETTAIVSIPFLLWIAATLIVAWRARVASPTRHLADELRAQRGRFGTALVLLLCYVLVNRAYRAIKVAIPRFEPFDADPMFVAWDRLLFGVDPWVLTHSVFDPLGTQVIDAIYVTWLFVILLAFGLSVFSADRAFQLRSSLTYFLVWIVLGNALAIVWSSAGPVYYEHFFGDPLFAPLMERLETQNLAALRLQEFLLSASGDEAIGSGISAMPSVHCAMTMYILIIAYDRFGLSIPFMLALLYHLAILVGSVHLAWHYAVDGLVSTLLVPILWWLAGRIIGQPGQDYKSPG